jgi:2-polyprenyl-6-methoxyphenol hydroxylase-like FAD-dependent oxidoreductase
MIPIPKGPVSVLIVGAGPSGLMMAAQLLRYGIQPVIIDKRLGPTDRSKALAVQARSLEIYRQLGIIDKVLSGGKPADGMQLYFKGKSIASLPIADIGQGSTPYPYVHIYQQFKNERALLDALTQHSCPVYWNTTLGSLKEGTGVVDVTLNNQEQEYKLLCHYLIGADGHHSAVRNKLHIPFAGEAYHNLFYLADVELDRDGRQMEMYITPNGFAGFFPMPETNMWRIVGSITGKRAKRDDLTFEEILPLLRDKVRKPIKIERCQWFSTYRLHHRMAEKFGHGRCFIIGDAAHVHSPVGGQGMNTGLQDAYNLSWKLAGVINNKLRSTILNSYAAERMPVAADLLKTTDRAFNFIMSRGIMANLFKRWILPLVLKRLWKNDKIKQELFTRISQIGVSYTHSDINLHLSQLQTIKAGDRLPYLKVFDEKKLQESDLHAWCSRPGFTLITIGQLQDSYIFSLAKYLSQNYAGWLNYFHLPPSVKNQHIYDTFQVRTGQNKCIIVRPDMHIGYINDVVDLEMMKNYLENVAGCIPTRAEN